jgi:hypothetical protein
MVYLRVSLVNFGAAAALLRHRLAGEDVCMNTPPLVLNRRTDARAKTAALAYGRQPSLESLAGPIRDGWPQMLALRWFRDGVLRFTTSRDLHQRDQ